jgi:hypothetical protein
MRKFYVFNCNLREKGEQSESARERTKHYLRFSTLEYIGDNIKIESRETGFEAIDRNELQLNDYQLQLSEYQLKLIASSVSTDTRLRAGRLRFNYRHGQ